MMHFSTIAFLAVLSHSLAHYVPSPNYYNYATAGGSNTLNGGGSGVVGGSVGGSVITVGGSGSQIGIVGGSSISGKQLVVSQNGQIYEIRPDQASVNCTVCRVCCEAKIPMQPLNGGNGGVFVNGGSGYLDGSGFQIQTNGGNGQLIGGGTGQVGGVIGTGQIGGGSGQTGGASGQVGGGSGTGQIGGGTNVIFGPNRNGYAVPPVVVPTTPVPCNPATTTTTTSARPCSVPTTTPYGPIPTELQTYATPPNHEYVTAPTTTTPGYVTPPKQTTAFPSYVTAPPSYPTSPFSIIPDKYEIPVTPIIPIFPPLPPSTSSCCLVRIHDIRATVSCGLVGRKCCNSQNGQCGNARTIVVQVPRGSLNIPSTSTITCEQAISLGIIRTADLNGFCAIGGNTGNGGNGETGGEVIIHPEIPTNVPFTLPPNGPNSGYVLPGDVQSSTASVSFFSSILTFVIATILCL